MNNIIIQKTISLIWKLFVAYSIYLLLRGHNEPGGGFIGGLLLALGFILRTYNTDSERLQQQILAVFPRLLGVLLLIFMLVILSPLVFEKVILQGLWTEIWMPFAGKFSSVLIFDVVVYFVVAISSIYAHILLMTPLKERQ